MQLPVEDHLKLFSAQFLARALQESHPSHCHVLQDHGHRPMKHTLRSKVLDLVEPYLDVSRRGKVVPDNFNWVQTAIHTDIVADTVTRLNQNQILGNRPPQVDSSEQSLPRIVRSTLCQLRSGFCSRLQSFQHRIGGAMDDLCPECSLSAHTPEHLLKVRGQHSSQSNTGCYLKPATEAIAPFEPTCESVVP